ncbi:MAG: carboxypeptidase-like regulatory domain-containing protein [Bacteroidia bacterium]
MNVKSVKFLVCFVFLASFVRGQDWTLKLRSRVELRSWKLTNRADKTEKSLPGASITLTKGSVVLNQTTTNADGDFEIDVPGKGEFILTITFAGCNTKKFSVSTNGVPDAVGKDNYKPTVSIGGFVMSKPIKGVDYLGLNEPLVKVEYKNNGQNFDKDETVTNKGMEIVSKIYDAETKIIEKFCATNKLGDDALNKLKNCPLAKEYYLKAINMLQDENYPVEQLAKAEQCIKDKEAVNAAAAEAAAKKAEAAKLTNEKAKAEKAAKDKEAFNKTAANKTNQEKEPAKKTVEPIKSVASNETEGSSSGGNGNSKHKVPQVIGANKYKETIIRADDYFKTKRYSEAKAAYQEALKLKAGDAYATGKLEQIERIVGPK